MKLGKKIKLLRIFHEISLARFAFEINVSKSYLSELENDIRKNPSLEIINKIAMFYKISLDNLVNEKLKIDIICIMEQLCGDK